MSEATDARVGPASGGYSPVSTAQIRPVARTAPRRHEPHRRRHEPARRLAETRYFVSACLPAGPRPYLFACPLPDAFSARPRPPVAPLRRVGRRARVLGHARHPLARPPRPRPARAGRRLPARAVPDDLGVRPLGGAHARRLRARPPLPARTRRLGAAARGPPPPRLRRSGVRRSRPHPRRPPLRPRRVSTHGADGPVRPADLARPRPRPPPVPRRARDLPRAPRHRLRARLLPPLPRAAGRGLAPPRRDHAARSPARRRPALGAADAAQPALPLQHAPRRQRPRRARSRRRSAHRRPAEHAPPPRPRRRDPAGGPAPRRARLPPGLLRHPARPLPGPARDRPRPCRRRSSTRSSRT